MDSTYKKLSELYRNPSFVGSFGGLRNFYENVKKYKPEFRHLKFKDIQDWSTEDRAYYRRKPSQLKTKTRKLKLFAPDNIWEGDLMDMSKFSKQNKGVKYVLVLVDQFTKKFYVAPLFRSSEDNKHKGKYSSLEAFKFIFKNTLDRPRIIFTDEGGEFVNSVVRNYLQKEQNIKVVVAKRKSTKASIAESGIRTLKTKIMNYIHESGNPQYIKHLQAFVNSINSSKQRITKFAPNDIDVTNVHEVYNNLNPTTSEKEKTNKSKENVLDIKEGDYVLVRIKKSQFERQYTQKWKNTIYQVKKIDKEIFPYHYKLQDLSGKQIDSIFYKSELNKIKFPLLFHFDKNFRPRTIKDPDKVKGKLVEIKIEEDKNSVFIPLFQYTKIKRKYKNREIPSSIFMKYLTEKN